MPKIRGYTPAWLDKPAPGSNLFAPAKVDSKASPFTSKTKPKPGPTRTIAQSGSQVFVAVGKEVRWADLIDLKERWEEKTSRGRPGARVKRESSANISDDEILKAAEEEDYAGFRTINVSVGSDIKQLVISPFADYLAVLTTHTVRICAVPDLAHLSQPNNEVIKPKWWSLGPTTHVNDRSPVASALWHPLGVNGSALVTVTTDAVVRVWELNPLDRWSFDKPTLTIDLIKLADGTSLDQNFSASTDVTRKGFSADSFEMDVAAACFASRGSGGWAPMTLWVAMTEGDVYALCPLLPSKWAPPPTLIPSLSVGIVGNLAAIEDDPNVSAARKLLAQQQLDWMTDLDNQEPTEVDGPLGEAPAEIYNRPSRPGVVPRLQGPFDLDMSPEMEDDQDTELTDIFVIGQKLDTAELMMGEDEELEVDDIDQEGLSLNVICLLSSSGQLRICLDTDGVEAQWLPPRNKFRFIRQEDEFEPTLLTFQTLDTLSSLEMTEGAWPMFSHDVTSRYAFYVTNPSSITYISLSPWVFRLEKELQGESDAGADFRIDLLVKGQSSIRERLHTIEGGVAKPIPAVVPIRDPDLGYLVLTATDDGPLCIIFDMPVDDFVPIKTSASPSVERSSDEVQPLDFYEPRPTFQAPHVFERNSDLPDMLLKLKTSKHKAIVGQEVRLSPATLQVFTDAHQILSGETHRLGTAASELFRRLETLQVELRKQIAKANEVKSRVDTITGEDQGSEPESSNSAVERRIQAAKQRGEALSQRLENMRRTVSRATTRELSDKERAWINEVRGMDASISGSGGPPAEGASRFKQVGKRYSEARSLKEELASQAGKIAQTTGDGEEAATAASDLRIPADIRRNRLSQVRSLLERETALVDAVKSRLEKLAVNG